MSDSDKKDEFLKKLTPCIERGEFEVCVEEAVKLARMMGVDASEILKISEQKEMIREFDFAYVLALVAVQGLEENKKALAYFKAGRAAEFLRKLTEAEKNYKKAIEINPKFAEAHYNYAVLLHKLNRKNEAEEYYKKAIEVNPKFAEAYCNYATLLLELNKKNEAEVYYKKAIEANPKLADAHYNYAVFLHNLNRKNEAEEHYKKAIELNPNDTGAHNNYANLLREKAQFSEAEKEVTIALQIKPEDPHALGTLGDILADEDYLEDAIIEYQKALKYSDSMKPSSISEIHNNLGYAYAVLGQYHRAKKEFNKALKLDPQNVKAKRNLRKLGKVEDGTELCKFKKCFAIKALLLIFITFSYYLFLINMLTMNVFAVQTTIFIALLIYAFFIHQIKWFRLKAGTVEFEMSPVSPRERFIEGKNLVEEFER